MGPLAHARWKKIGAFHRQSETITRVTVHGGGYDFTLGAPRAQAIIYLFVSASELGEAEGPVKVTAKAIGELNGEPTCRSITVGFDTVEPSKMTKYWLVSSLNRMRDSQSQTVDGRLERIGNLLCESFDDKAIAIRSIDVDLPGRIHRRFQDPIDIFRLLANLTGFKADQTNAGPTGSMVVTIHYTKSGKLTIAREKFSLKEYIIRENDLEVKIRQLADTLKQPGSPVPPRF